MKNISDHISKILSICLCIIRFKYSSTCEYESYRQNKSEYIYSGGKLIQIFDTTDLKKCLDEVENDIEILILESFDFYHKRYHDFNEFQNLHTLVLRMSKIILFSFNISKTTISVLNISNNFLTTLNEPEFLSSSIISIDLSCNQIEIIHKDFFKNLDKVKNILLQSNSIKIIENIFIKSYQLEILDLSSNSMLKLDRIILSQKFSFTNPTIILNKNNLTILPEFFASTSVLRIKKVYVHNNLNENFDLKSIVIQSLNEKFSPENHDMNPNVFYKITVLVYYFTFYKWESKYYGINYQQLIPILCWLKTSSFYGYKLQTRYDHSKFNYFLRYIRVNRTVQVFLTNDSFSCNCTDKKFKLNITELKNGSSSTYLFKFISKTFQISSSTNSIASTMKNYFKNSSASNRKKNNNSNAFFSKLKSFRIELAKFVIERPTFFIRLYFFSILLFLSSILTVQIIINFSS